MATSRRWSGTFKVRPLAGLCGIALIEVLLLGPLRIEGSGSSSDGTEIRFTAATVPLNSLNLFDLGVTDVNGDGRLDVFTSNHSGLQSLLLGESGDHFSDVFSAWRLDQNPEFAGFDVPDSRPAIDEPGLYIYRRSGDLVLRLHGSKGLVTTGGSVYLPVETELHESENFDVAVSKGTQPAGESTIRFTAKGDGSLALRPNLVGVPMSLHLDPEVPLDRVYVGQQKVRPRSHDFTLTLRDRHGIAWADWNADGRMDMFVVRGGLRGHFSEQPPGVLSNELLCNVRGSFQDCTEQAGIVKVCRGREAAWVDFDNDGRLDLYVGCQDSPNQLYRSTAQGHFQDVAPELGLDRVKSGAANWLDADGDGDMDLFLVEKSGYWLYVNESGAFRPSLVCQAKAAEKLTVADFDGDGDPDIFAGSRKRSLLLVNTGGVFHCQDPTLLGLPSVAWTANWVDFDNDGLMDLHAVPGGLYRQLPGHRFSRVSSLEPAELNSAVDARCTWFDADNDGDRDLLMAVQRPKRRWEVTLLRNPGSFNHWLEVDLVGSGGNREAIGARVMAVAGADVQVQQVGQAEGAHFSRGHYRLYFGLGSHAQINTLRIWWPDGEIQDLKDVKADGLLRIEQRSARLR